MLRGVKASTPTTTASLGDERASKQAKQSKAGGARERTESATAGGLELGGGGDLSVPPSGFVVALGARSRCPGIERAERRGEEEEENAGWLARPTRAGVE